MFWHDNLLQGGALKSIFPLLHKLATREKRTVTTEMKDSNWIRCLAKVSTMQELVQFLQFWGTLFQVQLHPHADTITWTWIEKGQCSARSGWYFVTVPLQLT